MACKDFDGQVVRLHDELAALSDRFVRVRVTAMDGVDLSLFDFDYDMSWAALFLNGDGEVYGRYGTRDGGPYDAEDLISIRGLARAMERVLALYDVYPDNRDLLRAKRPKYVEWDRVDQIPARRRLGFGACYHCHHVAEGIARTEIERGDPLNERRIWPYPPASRLGIDLDRSDDVNVTSVVDGSCAGLAGVRPGDRLVDVEGVPLVAHADLQWALHQLPPETTSLKLGVDRDGEELTMKLALPEGWRRGDAAWRESRWRIRPGVSWSRCDDATREKRAIGPGMALRVTRVYGAGVRKEGLLRNDVMVACDGFDADVDEGELLFRLRRNYRPGSVIPVRVLRDGEVVERTLLID